MGRKKGGGGKLNRSEVIQARLDPKLHLAAEILARVHRRTLSSVIEVLIEAAAEETKVAAAVSDNTQIDITLLKRKKREKISIKDIVDLMWSGEEADQFVMMALLLPDHLTADEANLWCLIKETPYFWTHFSINVESCKGEVIDQKTWPLINQSGVIKENLRELWPLLKDIRDGKKSSNDLRKLNLPEGYLIDRPKDYPHEIKVIGG
jgi:hypothetical protein